MRTEQRVTVTGDVRTWIPRPRRSSGGQWRGSFYFVLADSLSSVVHRRRLTRGSLTTANQISFASSCLRWNPAVDRNEPTG